MPQTFPFEHKNDIVIAAPPEKIFDYVTNPKSWPEWLPSSHHIDCENRPMRFGDTFHEHWSTRSGRVDLDWVVIACDRPSLWIGLTYTSFIGLVVVQYNLEQAAGGTRFVRTVRNPQRPKAATADQLRYSMRRRSSGCRISRPRWKAVNCCEITPAASTWRHHRGYR